MNAAPGKHPAPEVLQAFGLGQLDDAALTQVSLHLETCVDCKRQVAELPGDSLLDKLRQANSPAGAKQLPPTTPPPSSVPPELRDNTQYDILRELGAGGMGVVYLAKNKLMDRLEVLKVISTTMVHKARALDRFLREIRAAAALSHDNVVKAYSALQFGELLVFAMEFVEGDDLAKVVKTQGPLPIANACYYARQVALGLQHAHDKNMVHRDIKPHNLILARVGKKHMVKILDFGLAKASSEKKLDRDLTGEGAMLGTPDYMAPEQSLDASTADIRADIYSLGCTLYYLLNGAPPFDAANLVGLLLAHQSTEARSLNLARPEVPVELAAVVAKMMAKDPARRYQKPLDVAQALTPFFTTSGVKGPEGPPAVSVGAGAQAPPRRPEVAAKRPDPVAASRPATLVQRDKSAAAPPILAPLPVAQNPVPKKARAKTQGPKRSKRLLLAGGVLSMGVAFLGLLLWGAGVFRVQTKDGALVVQVNEPNADVLVDGEKVTVTWGADGKQAEIRVKPGTRQVSVKKEGFSAHGETVTLADGGRQVIVARLERTPVVSGTPPQPRRDPPPAPTDGFVSLFNGKDLAGWKVESGGDGHWSVEGGALVGRSANFTTHSYLLTTRDYADFSFRFEFMIDRGSQGGVAVRAIEGEKVPQPNGVRVFHHPLVWLMDLARWPKEAVGMTSWVKDDKRHFDPTTNVGQLALGEWHAMEITILGDTCTAFLAGKSIVDLRLDPKSGSGTTPALMRKKGKIGILAQTGTIRYRGLQIKELTTASKPPPVDPAPTFKSPSQPPPGAIVLFDGTSLANWVKRAGGGPADWKLLDGGAMEVGPSDIFTRQKFGPDYQLHVEFWIPLMPNARGQARGNSGVFLQGRHEVQILDSSGIPTPGVGDCGALFGLIAPNQNACKPPEQWQTFDITFHAPGPGKSGRLTVVLNGTTVIDNMGFDRTSPLPLDKAILDPGPILLQSHGAKVRFRNLWLLPLTAPTESTKTVSADFVPLFNGKDLSGWKTHPKQPGNWRVVSGVLTGSGPGPLSYLYTERNDFRDYHLRLEARINDKGPSAVFFRTPFGPGRPPKGPTRPLGYVAAISPAGWRTGKGKKQAVHQTGTLFRDAALVASVPEALMSADDWFVFEVIARDNHLVTKVNGQPAADYVDATRSHISGHIAVEQNGPATVIEFRKIEIKILP